MRRVSGKGAPPAVGDTLGALAAHPPGPPPNADATPQLMIVKPKRDKPTKDATAKKNKPAKAGKSAKPEKAKRVTLKLRVPADVSKAFRKAAAVQQAKRGEFLARIFAVWRGRNPA